VIEPKPEYERRLQGWRERIAALDSSHLIISNSRLGIAAAAVLVFWLSIVRNAIAVEWLLAPVVAFVALIVIHARVLQRVERARRAALWYARGLDRLDGRWTRRARDGERFTGLHPCARDLDLFGRASLFELLNTANTEAGEETLAHWVAEGASNPEVTRRHAAVDELRTKIDFREDLAVLSAESDVSRTGTMAAWARAEPAGLGTASAIILVACAIVMLAVAALVFGDRLASGWLLGWLLVEMALALAWRRPVQLVLGRIATADRDLALVRDVLARIETESFAAPRLAQIRDSLLTRGVPPSQRIAQLRRLVSWLDSTRNQMFAPIAFALLLPQLLAVAIDRWHAAYGAHVVEWLNGIGELEAFSAVGTYAFEHPRDPFPELVEGGPVFEAAAVAHPLMPESACVPNDVALGGAAPHVLVVSGSNMSGKSTLLRSVGVNVVLALMGAPIRASRLRVSPVCVGATLKVEDSLQAGHSRFYAEILRIRDIVAGARTTPTMFLLDEILHGTNSYDRRIGAEAIVRALVSLNAIGLVTTHDLALTELPEKLGGVALNMHFEDRLENGLLAFDYRMRPGVVQHSNALALMRAVGLDV
jgi:hypothetical protein